MANKNETDMKTCIHIKIFLNVLYGGAINKYKLIRETINNVDNQLELW